jgi:catechol 2,3-dioxygenase-like lactoylglutathione lyase family enzyme
MDMKIELVNVPVTDVDAAKAFYVEKMGFHDDIDMVVSDDLRFVQLTPPGSACSIVIGRGTTDMAPGSQRGLLMVVSDVEAQRDELIGRGVEATEVKDEGWGLFTYISDPDGNTWSLQQMPTDYPQAVKEALNTDETAPATA